MQHTREHEFVDVLGTVAEMRSHRLSMVQTEVSPTPGALPQPATGGSLGRPHSPAPPPVQEQYVFIHQCILLMWQKKKQQQVVASDVVYENTSKT